MRNLKEFEMIEPAFLSTKAKTNFFPLSINVNKSFRITGSWDTKIFKKSNHIFEVRGHKSFDDRFKVDRFFMPFFKIELISFIVGLLRGFRVNKNISNFIFKRNNIWDNRIFMMIKKFIKVISIHDGIIFRIFKDNELEFSNFPIKIHRIIFRKLIIVINNSLIKVTINILHNMEIVKLNFDTFSIDINDSRWKGREHITDNTQGSDTPKSLTMRKNEAISGASYDRIGAMYRILFLSPNLSESIRCGLLERSGATSSKHLIPDGLSLNKISLIEYLSASVCFHLSIVGREAVTFREREKRFLTLDTGLLSKILLATASALSRLVAFWYFSMSSIGRGRGKVLTLQLGFRHLAYTV